MSRFNEIEKKRINLDTAHAVFLKGFMARLAFHANRLHLVRGSSFFLPLSLFLDKYKTRTLFMSHPVPRPNNDCCV